MSHRSISGGALLAVPFRVADAGPIATCRLLVAIVPAARPGPEAK
jgi:hypothetical protein